jgi:hypothetical protein
VPIDILDPTTPVAEPVPEKEYLTGGSRAPLWGGFQSLASHVLTAIEYGGPYLSDLMLLDEKISGGIRTIKDGVLSQGHQITATVQIDPEDSPDDVTQADIDLAFTIEDHCERAWRNLTASNELLRRMLDAMAYRTMLAEVVRTVPDSGPDAGLYTLDHITVKEPGTWAFVRDAYGNTRGIQGDSINPDGRSGPPRILPLEKFLVLPWLPRGSNPGGQGLLGEAYNYWNFKVQLWPRIWEYEELFASPTVHASPPEGAQYNQRRKAYGPDGQAITGEVPATVALHREIVLMMARGTRVIVTPPGATFDLKTPAGNGAVYQMILEKLDQAILYAMHQTTLTLGVQGKRSNGTTAASGQDMLGLVISYGKWALKEMLENYLWRPHVAMNWGPDVAARFTPEVSFGMTNPEDFSRNSAAIARLWGTSGTGVLQTEDERQGALRFLGLANALRRRRKSTPGGGLSKTPAQGKRPINVRTAA